MTTCITQSGRSSATIWARRILLQYFTAASFRTMSGARSRGAARSLRIYLTRLALVLVAGSVLGACSDAATEPTPPPAKPVATIAVSPDALQLAVGETRQLSAAPRDAEGNALTRPVSWSSSNTSIATVDASGMVRAVAGGAVLITAVAEGKEAKAAVQVQAIPVELELSRTTLQFTGIAAIMTPAPQTSDVTSKNGAADGLVVDVTYGAGQPTGWLAATLSAPVAPATLNIIAATGNLLPGSYTARVAVRSTTRPEIFERGIDVLFTVKPGPQLDVSTSDRHNCAVDRNGVIACWGYNGSRQLGNGSIAQWENTPQTLPGGHRFMSMTTGELHACGITPDAKAYCWGTGFMGDDQGAVNGVAPRQVMGSQSWVQLAAGYRHTCGIALDGRTYCWGANNGGQIGNGTRVSQSLPVEVAGGHAFVALSAGEEHTCALTAVGEAYCWGRTAYGRLGMNVLSTDAEVRPVKVPGGMLWSAIDAGRLHTCAVTKAGEAYCWGYNGNGQLGEDSRTTRTSPTPVATSVRFTTISAGNAHTCAIAVNGAGYCWGLRSPGALGDGVRDGYALNPVQVAGGLAFKRITAGNSHSCAVSTADAVYCWGINNAGAIGDGSNSDRLQPVWVRLN